MAQNRLKAKFIDSIRKYAVYNTWLFIYLLFNLIRYKTLYFNYKSTNLILDWCFFISEEKATKN